MAAAGCQKQPVRWLTWRTFGNNNAWRRQVVVKAMLSENSPMSSVVVSATPEYPTLRRGRNRGYIAAFKLLEPSWFHPDLAEFT